jgi:dihydroorotase
MSTILIKNATLVNENKQFESDLLIKNQRIERIDKDISAKTDHVIDAEGLHLIPGMIDDQVHFREPGFTHKGHIESESKAAVAGGVTSYMEMPNTVPQTLTSDVLEDKYKIANGKSYANYSFYFGASNTNLEDIKKINPLATGGLKVFMGASTGNMLVDDPDILNEIF